MKTIAIMDANEEAELLALVGEGKWAERIKGATSFYAPDPVPCYTPVAFEPIYTWSGNAVVNTDYFPTRYVTGIIETCAAFKAKNYSWEEVSTIGYCYDPSGQLRDASYYRQYLQDNP